jgi:putative endonuclease
LHSNKDTGQRGESLASRFLKKKGVLIVERNWRSGRYELDLIGRLEDKLIFIEVKTRLSRNYGNPEEAVDGQKIEHIKRAAEQYLHYTGWEGPIRFDILAIVKDGDEPEIHHIEDAFF